MVFIDALFELDWNLTARCASMRGARWRVFGGCHHADSILIWRDWRPCRHTSRPPWRFALRARGWYLHGGTSLASAAPRRECAGVARARCLHCVRRLTRPGTPVGNDLKTRVRALTLRA